VSEEESITRTVTREEFDVIELLGLASNRMNKLDESYSGERNKFFSIVSILQNSILARPAIETIPELMDLYGRGFYTRLDWPFTGEDEEE